MASQQHTYPPSLLLCFVLVAGAAYGFSKHQTKQYTATA